MYSSVAKHTRQTVPVFVILAALLAITSAVSPPFRTEVNLVNFTSQVAALALVALGQTIVILQSGIDLSVGSVMSLSTVIMATLTGQNGWWVPLGVVCTLFAGVVVGFLNGAGVVWFRVPPLIMTLATMALVKGIALYILPQPGGMVNVDLANFVSSSYGPVSMMGIIVLVFYVAFWFLLANTRFGRYTFAVGGYSGDTDPARKSGVPVRRVQISGYMVSGVMAAVAGIVLSARIYSGDPGIGDPFALDSIVAVVIGGTSLFGGVGGIVGTFAGATLFALIGNILNMLSVPTFYQDVVEGLILVVALVSYEFGRRREARQWA